MRTEAEAETHIRLKVQNDEEFRNRLIRDPRAVILAETGVDLSDGKLAFVNEEIRNRIIGADSSDRPLTEAELERIAAGMSWDSFSRGMRTRVNIFEAEEE